jgi:hypothetical protein
VGKAQAWKNAFGALEEAIAARIDDGDPLPAPATEAQIKRHRGVWVRSRDFGLPLTTPCARAPAHPHSDGAVRPRS